MPIEATLLVLLLIANGSPVVARALLRERLDRPLDGGRLMADGRPLLGPSKTVTGVIVGAMSSALLAPLLGLSAWLGALIGLGSMVGDAASSFVKRRLGRAPGAMALGLDQLPESLLPMLLCWPLLELHWTTVLLVPVLFLFANLAISRLSTLFGLDHHPH
jgi:CDP-2,3-bis-(O-geranylgeranyl)-sn-glycerol synthase